MKRVLSALLALVLLLGVISVADLKINAASSLKTSEACIALLKQIEGFTKYPKKDATQYSVGYGCKCPADKFDQWSKNGISEAEADALMRQYLSSMEADVNTYIDRNHLTLTQGQFDAMISLTYNLGSAWLAPTASGIIQSAVLNGASGNDILYAFSQATKSNGVVLHGLIIRRLKEANMYLNGEYSNTAPANYSYVKYDAAGGTTPAPIQAYDVNSPVAPFPVPTLEGHKFLGWFTAAEGGEQVTVLNADTRGKTLYAHWEADANVTVSTLKEMLVAYYRTAPKQINVYDIPGGNVTSTISGGTEIRVIGEHKDADGYVWCHVQGSGWIKYIDTKASYVTNIDAVTVTVTANGVNMRKGPGTSYSRYTADSNNTPDDPSDDKIVKLSKGTQLEITATANGSGYLWGRFTMDGTELWVALTYTNYDSVKQEQPPATEPPATEPPATDPPATEPPATEPPATEPPATEPPATEPPATEPPATEPPATEPQPAAPVIIATGNVINTGAAKLYGEAGGEGKVVRTLKNNAKVDIYELRTLNSGIWGKTSKGWIDMKCVKVNASSVTEEAKAVVTTGLKGKTRADVNMRGGAGTEFAVVEQLKINTVVEILERKIVGDKVWGRTARGWIWMHCVVLDNDPDKDKYVIPEEPKPTEPKPTEPEATEPSDTEKPSENVAGTAMTGFATFGKKLKMPVEIVVNMAKAAQSRMP